MHGIFPTHNKYYRAHEIFPYLSKAEKKEVFSPAKKSKHTTSNTPRIRDEDEETAPVKIKHK